MEAAPSSTVACYTPDLFREEKAFLLQGPLSPVGSSEKPTPNPSAQLSTCPEGFPVEGR